MGGRGRKGVQDVGGRQVREGRVGEEEERGIESIWLMSNCKQEIRVTEISKFVSLRSHF